ncbi:hypothetical protein AKO1_015411 [Acrasis kona]|uniref:Uncharacterized protein n=1 Tax=Acrasis kona TaxID=1008807 RepID=A0AAW2YKY0_9EUKA
MKTNKLPEAVVEVVLPNRASPDRYDNQRALNCVLGHPEKFGHRNCYIVIHDEIVHVAQTIDDVDDFIQTHRNTAHSWVGPEREPVYQDLVDFEDRGEYSKIEDAVINDLKVQGNSGLIKADYHDQENMAPDNNYVRNIHLAGSRRFFTSTVTSLRDRDNSSKVVTYIVDTSAPVTKLHFDVFRIIETERVTYPIKVCLSDSTLKEEESFLAVAKNTTRTLHDGINLLGMDVIKHAGLSIESKKHPGRYHLDFNFHDGSVPKFTGQSVKRYKTTDNHNS